MKLEETAALNVLPHIPGIHEFFKEGFWFEASFRGLYLPAKPDLDDNYRTIYYLKDEIRPRKEAELLRKSILDESLPLHMKLLKNGRHYSCFDGGRVGDAVVLGVIRYAPAIPELLEVLKHDYAEDMRDAAAGALGDMEKAAWHVAGELVERLFIEKEMWIRTEIATSIRKIRNPAVAFRLRDACENLITELEAYEALGYFNCGDERKEDLLGWGFVCLDEALHALFKCSKEQGREVISRALRSESRHVVHGAKRAFLFSGMYSEPRLVWTPEDIRKYFKRLKGKISQGI